MGECMSEPFLSEIKIVSFSFAPKGWALCNGQVLPINQNQALFALIGTTYGGDGRITFALPDLQGRVPRHTGQGHALGEQGGEQNHALATGEMPPHTHGVQASSAASGGNSSPVNRFLGGGTDVYHAPANPTPMAPATLAGAGGNQPHPNMQPFLVVSFCIALTGMFPSH